MIDWILDLFGLTQEEVGDEPEVSPVLIIDG